MMIDNDSDSVDELLLLIVSGKKKKAIISPVPGLSVISN